MVVGVGAGQGRDPDAGQAVGEGAGQGGQDAVGAGGRAPGRPGPVQRRAVVAHHERVLPSGRGAEVSGVVQCGVVLGGVVLCGVVSGPGWRQPAQGVQCREDSARAGGVGPVDVRAVGQRFEQGGFGAGDGHGVRAEAEQRQVVQGVPGDEDLLRRPAQLPGEQPQGGALGRARRQHVEVAVGRVLPGAAELPDGVGEFMGEPVRGEVVGAAAVLDHAVLVVESGEAAQGGAHPLRARPAGAQLFLQRVHRGEVGAVDHGRAHVGDDPSRLRDQWVAEQFPDGVQGAAGGEDQRHLGVALQGVP